MSLAGCSALLLLLGAITLGLAQVAPNCVIPNVTAQSDLYNVTVAPGTLVNKTLYTVTVTSKSNEEVQVLFEALETTKKTAVGTWTLAANSTNCSGTFWYGLNPNKSLVANWNSPSSVPKSVEVKVSVRNTTVVHKLSRTLNVKDSASSVQSLSMFLTLGLLVITNKLL